MLPLIASGTFTTHQTIDWRVDWYPSSSGVPETGIGFRIGALNSSFTNAGMSAAADSATYMESNCTPVISDDGTTWKYGLNTSVLEFWEAGAPLGISTARKAVLHWRGYIASDRSWIDGPSGDFWLSFFGKGSIKVVHNGATVLNTTLKSDNIVSTSLIDPTPGQQIDIYYWQNGEPWGGVVCKYVPKLRSTQSTPDLNDFRTSPVLSASLLPYATASATTLQRVIEATVNINDPLDIPELTFTVGLSNDFDPYGWTLLSNPTRLQHYDGTTTITLKRGQLIKFYGGFANEQYERFTGTITDMSESDGKVTVTCQGLISKLQKISVANYPDRLSYGTFGYLSTTSTADPIKDIRAYDNWPIEYAVKDLCYKGKIDSKLLWGNFQYFNNSSVVNKEDSRRTRIVYDSFTGSNGTTLDNHAPETEQAWINVGAVVLNTNRAYSTSTTAAHPVVDAEYSDYVRITANFTDSSGSTSGSHLKLVFRGSGSSSFTGYAWGAERTSSSLVTLRLSRFSAGSQVATLYSTTSYSWPANTTKRLIVELRGSQIKAFIADSEGASETLLTTQTDTNVALTNSYMGLRLAAQSGQNVSADDFEVHQIRPFAYLSGESLIGTPLKLPRNSKYGNSGSGFSPDKPNDDEYLYAPDASRSVGDYCKELADGLAFDFRVNSQGYIVLTKRNNPDRVVKLSVGTTTYSPGALVGYYQNISGAFSSKTQVWANRIDLVVARTATSGTVAYSVKSANGATTYASGTVNLALTGYTDPLFFYDNRFSITGNNACVFTLYSGHWQQYIVELSNSSGTVFLLDGLLLYYNDPITANLPETLLTTKQVLGLRTESIADDTRNHVVVIGKRKATITDSTKFKNPNNPENEFFVSTGVDIDSIYDSDADNYFGGLDSVVIVDTTVADQDFADWVAQTLLTRQRLPKPKAQIEHTLIPVLEPRDTIAVSDEKFASIIGSQNLWVVGITENYERTSATSRITTTSYQELPSYEPRHDITLDIIDSQYAGKAAVNLNITYPSLDGTTKTNPGPGLPRTYCTRVDKVSRTVSSDANGEYIDMTGYAWPPIPDSIVLGEDTTNTSYWKTNPYIKLTHIYDYTTKKIHIPCQAGSGETSYTRAGAGGYSYFAGLTGSSVKVSYLGIDTATPVGTVYSGIGGSPFYDPYTSEIPGDNLVQITFDALVSGYYRVSIWGITKGASKSVPVAWLTEQEQESIDPENHWTYFTSGKTKTFKWDGVDNIGEWNKLQSENYAWTARGIFEQEQKPQIGKGFYAWNDQESDLVTISGHVMSGKLLFNDEHYSTFFVKIDVKADMFLDTMEPIRTTRSDKLDTANGQNPQITTYIYTHLPPPTRIKIHEVEDWNPTAGTWQREDPSEAGWVTTPDTAATIRNGKPIRITLRAQARPGTRFNNDPNLTSFKVNRIAHLDVNLMDLFLIFNGTPWYQGVSSENKRLVARRLTNEEHTVNFQDTDFRTGDSLELDNAKWIFEPKDFLINDEPVEYCDYLQIEDVPSFSINRELGEGRSRFLLAYMNYLFYLSVYTQDRSGRMCWAIDENFIDKTKILQHTFPTRAPEDPENYFIRTILTRQWNNPDYVSELATKWTIPAGNQKFIQFYHDRLEFTDTDSGAALRLDANGGNVTGALTTAYTDSYTANTSKILGTYTTARQLGLTSVLDFFGEWTWEGQTGGTTANSNVDPYWIPCLSREFHPYFVVPPMPLQIAINNNYSQTSVSGFNTGHDDEAQTKVWQSRAVSMDFTLAEQKFYSYSNWETYLKNEKTVRGGYLDYTRQDERKLWEHVRGMYTSSARAELEEENTRSPIYSKPSSPYYINTMHYDTFVFSALNTDKKFDVGNNVKTSVDVVAGEFFEYNFLHQYNWYSASFFPVRNGLGMLRSEYTNSKYTGFAIPSNVVFDSGAWAGFKPDRGTGSAKLYWTTPGSMKLAGTGGSGASGHNIFSIWFRAPLYATSTEPPEIKRVMMSLALVNSRRLSPIVGK